MKYHQIGRRRAGGGQGRALGASFALGLALLFAPLPARATELAGAELHVERTPSAYDCPDAPALAETSAALGSVPLRPAEALRLQVHFQRSPDGYVALIEATGRKRGTRELQSPATTCAPLAETVSVVLAILTDLIPQQADTPTLVPPPIASPAAQAPPPRPAVTFALGPEFGVAYGLVGNAATATAALAARARYGAGELALGALWSTPHFEPVPPGIVSLSLLAGTALGCLWFGREQRAAMGGCAGIGLGSLHGSGHGYDNDGASTAFWAAGLASAVAELRLRPHWALRCALSAVVPFSSDLFAVAPNEQGVRTAPAAILGQFGPEYRFW